MLNQTRPQLRTLLRFPQRYDITVEQAEVISRNYYTLLQNCRPSLRSRLSVCMCVWFVMLVIRSPLRRRRLCAESIPKESTVLESYDSEQIGTRKWNSLRIKLSGFFPADLVSLGLGPGLESERIFILGKNPRSNERTNEHQEPPTLAFATQDPLRSELASVLRWLKGFLAGWQENSPGAQLGVFSLSILLKRYRSSCPKRTGRTSASRDLNHLKGFIEICTICHH